MRRAIPGIAVLAAGLLYLTGARRAAPGRRPGPVGRRDRPDHRRHRQGQLRLAAGSDHRLEPGPPRPAGHPAAAARGGQRPAGPAGRQPAGQERPVRRHRHGCHLDRRVRLERLDHPPAAGQFHSEFLKPAVDTAMYQGRLYAVPDYSNADLLYYRKDILAKAGQQPPRTWAQLQQLAKTVAPRYGLYGYAGTFAPYEGLTVNFATAIQSAGGSFSPRKAPRSPSTRPRRSRACSSWSTGSGRAGFPRSRSPTRKSHRGTHWRPASSVPRQLA